MIVIFSLSNRNINYCPPFHELILIKSLFFPIFPGLSSDLPWTFPRLDFPWTFPRRFPDLTFPRLDFPQTFPKLDFPQTFPRLDFPQTISISSLDFPYTFHGLSLDFPTTCLILHPYWLHTYHPIPKAKY